MVVVRIQISIHSQEVSQIGFPAFCATTEVYISSEASDLRNLPSVHLCCLMLHAYDAETLFHHIDALFMPHHQAAGVHRTPAPCAVLASASGSLGDDSFSVH